MVLLFPASVFLLHTAPSQACGWRREPEQQAAAAAVARGARQGGSARALDERRPSGARVGGPTRARAGGGPRQEALGAGASGPRRAGGAARSAHRSRRRTAGGRPERGLRQHRRGVRFGSGAVAPGAGGARTRGPKRARARGRQATAALARRGPRCGGGSASAARWRVVWHGQNCLLLCTPPPHRRGPPVGLPPHPLIPKMNSWYTARPSPAAGMACFHQN
jgi:hypothetical protein